MDVMTLNFSISRVIEKYPKINIGVLIGEDIDNNSPINELGVIQRTALRRARKQIGDESPIHHPHIASWRDMYRSFGTKPADYRPSAEALIRRALKTGKLPQINNAVDLYNIISVNHLIPMGGFDAEKVDGDIWLRVSSGGEKFTPLGRSQSKTTYQGEIVYSDDTRILTRRWNYRDADETKITRDTSKVVLFIDGSPEIMYSTIEKALMELETLLRRHCGGTYHKHVTNMDNPVQNLY